MFRKLLSGMFGQKDDEEKVANIVAEEKKEIPVFARKVKPTPHTLMPTPTTDFPTLMLETDIEKRLFAITAQYPDIGSSNPGMTEVSLARRLPFLPLLSYKFSCLIWHKIAPDHFILSMEYNYIELQ